jgi:hypothetical protein
MRQTLTLVSKSFVTQVNPIKILLYESKGKQGLQIGNAETYRAMREIKFLTHDLSRGMSRHKAISSPRCWSTSFTSIASNHQVSPKEQLDLPQRLYHKGIYQPPSITLMRPPLRSFSTKEGGIHIPRTQVSTPLHTTLEAWM